MIVVNLNKTFPTWAEKFAVTAPVDDLHQVKIADLHGLAEICAGDWWRIPELAIAQYGDLLVGCYANQIVAAYHISGHRQDKATGRVRFTIKPAYDYSGIIGAGQPGGPWKQGEARGSRHLPLDDYTDRYMGKPNARAWKHTGAGRAALRAPQITRDPTPPVQVTHPARVSFSWPHLGEITISWTTTGILEIAVPEGTRTRTVKTPAPRRRAAARSAATKKSTKPAVEATKKSEPTA